MRLRKTQHCRGRAARILPLIIAAAVCGCDMPVGNGFSLVLGQSNGQPFQALSDGDGVQSFFGGQGGMHFFLSLRATGFAPESSVSITVSAVLSDDGGVVIREFTQPEPLTDIGDGLYERLDRLIRFDVFPPSIVIDQDMDITVTLADEADPPNTVTVTQRLHVLPPLS